MQHYKIIHTSFMHKLVTPPEIDEQQHNDLNETSTAEFCVVFEALEQWKAVGSIDVLLNLWGFFVLLENSKSKVDYRHSLNYTYQKSKS